VRIQPEELKTFCIEALTALKVPKHDAEIVASNLIEAELRGLSSHGVMRLKSYTSKLAHGGFNPTPNIRFVKNRPSMAVLDGDNGLGAVSGTRAMSLCLEKARKTGVACTVVRGGNHYGIAAFYSMMALETDMIGITLCNTTPKVAVWGSIEPVLGTNPLSIAVPAGQKYPLVFDAATSVLARGKIIMADAEGKQLPPGAALDQHGRPTLDPKEALQGILMPFGSYKGSGISIMIDVLSALLSGALYGIHIPELFADFSQGQNLGFFFGAIDIESFVDLENFKTHIDQMIDDLKAARKAEGIDEIYMPGELEFLKKEENLKQGIQIETEVLNDLLEIKERFGLQYEPGVWMNH
jgi:LDH2 family malate/lactate/ureidoglycolate dehydrogenase